SEEHTSELQSRFDLVCRLLLEKNNSENTQEIMGIARSLPLFMIIPAIIAPILEEIIFRKIIYGRLYKRTNFFIAAIITAYIFGIIHGEPEHILVYASMCLVFAFLYIKTDSILTPIIVHMGLNFFFVISRCPLESTLFPYTTLFR